MLEPTQRLEYLGFLVDTVEMKFFLPEMKILKIQDLAEKFLSEQISARQLASLLGLLQATLPAITIAPLYFRNLQRPFQGSKFLRRKTKLPDSGCAFLGVKRGVAVVGKLASFPQREKFSGSKRTGNDFLRCLKERLGSSFGPLRNRRTLVLGRANPARECSRTSNGSGLSELFLAIKALLPKIDKPHVQFAIDN